MSAMSGMLFGHLPMFMIGPYFCMTKRQIVFMNLFFGVNTMRQQEHPCCAMLIAAVVTSSAAQASTANLYFKSNTDNSYLARHVNDGYCMEDYPMDDIGFNGLRTRVPPGAVTHIHYSSSAFHCAWHESWFDFVVSDAHGHRADIRWYKHASGDLPYLTIHSDPNHLIKHWDSAYHDNDLSRGGYYSSTITLSY